MLLKRQEELREHVLRYLKYTGVRTAAAYK
jgi:hypothetical protein